jgi:GT2 family glycosyltransferase/MoaA/NifB/PqqE/SkfB family radical SAM enzyme
MISIIIVNFNGSNFLDACLSSLTVQTDQDFETIIVDNASTDDSIDRILNSYQWVKLIENKENRGFAGGVNDGIRVSNGEYILTLNTDTIADPHFIGEMKKAMDQDPSAGMCASKMLFLNGRINSTGICICRSGAAWDRGVFEEDRGQYDTDTEIFGPCAGAALYRKKMLDEIGLFDEDFFLFMEDVDLAFRARLAGWKCVYVPTARVLHVKGGTTGYQSDISIYYGNRNLVWYVVKNYPTRTLFLYLPWIMIRNSAEIFYYAKEGMLSTILKSKRDMVLGIGKMVKKRRIIRKTVGRQYIERWIQPWNTMRREEHDSEISGCIDHPLEGQMTWNRISVSGWILPPEKIDHILVEKNNNDSTCIQLGTDIRPDVGSRFPNVRDADRGGFKGIINLGENEGPCQLSIFGVTTKGKKILIGEKTVINSHSEISKKPKFFQVALTNKCNLSCTMCPAHSGSSSWEGPGLTINPQLLEKSLESLRYYAKNIKRVALSEFGEPFLYKEIFDVIEKVYEICPQAKIILTSNGTLFSEPLIKKIIDSHLTEVAISLDAGSEKTYEKIRIGADFHQVTNGIKKFIEIRNLQGKKTPKIYTNFVLMHSNIHELPDYVRLAVDLGVDHIQTVNPFGISDGDCKEILYAMPQKNSIPGIKKYEEIIKEAQSIAQEAGITFSLPAFYPSLPTTECLGRGRSLVSISPTGDVYPCCIMAAKGPERGSVIKPFGNIIDNSIGEIWNSEPFIHYRESFYKGVPPNAICLQCPRYYHI